MSDASAAMTAIVRGRVQGVGFRDFVAMRARALGLAGYVRNMGDHQSVEVVAEGPRQKLERLIAQLHGGPGMSRVDSVDVEWRKPDAEHVTFEVRY